MSDGRRRYATVLRVQGAYYVLTGAWPLLSIGTFQAVTGPKTDLWLVKMVGILAVVIGAALLVAARGGRPGTETVTLAAGTGIGFASVDLVYSLAGRISLVYLADVPPELFFVGAALVHAVRAGYDGGAGKAA